MVSVMNLFKTVGNGCDTRHPAELDSSARRELSIVINFIHQLFRKISYCIFVTSTPSVLRTPFKDHVVAVVLSFEHKVVNSDVESWS